MQLDLVFDQNPKTLPAGFVMDVEYVEKLYDALFTNNVTITMDIGFGEVRGLPIYPGFIGEPDSTQYYSESYAAVQAALLAQNAPGSSSLPLSSPLPGSLRLSQAQAKALGFATAAGLDAYVGFSANANWSYAIPGQPGTGTIYSGQDECLSLIEHEVSEAMGRRSDLQGEITYSNGAINYGLGEPTYYTPMDLYRYRGPGVIDTPLNESNVTAYFSLDRGVSQLGIFDSRDDFLDHSDWYPNGPTANGNDAFNAFPKTGVANPISQTDLSLMAAIGWTVDNTPPALAIVSAAITSANTLVVSGAASDMVGVTNVEIFDGSTDLGRATYDPSTGAWTFQTALASGVTADLFAVATDQANNDASASVTLADIASPLTAYDAAGFAYLIESSPTNVETVVDTSAAVHANLAALTALGRAGHIASITSMNTDNSQTATYYGGDYVTRTVVTGVVTAPYSAHEYDYVGDVFAGSKFTYTKSASGAAYSSYETDFDFAGAYQGMEVFFTNLTGLSYTAKEVDFDASGNVTRIVLTGVGGQLYFALERDYAAGVFAGRKVFYQISGQPYTGKEVDVLANGELAKVVYSGMIGKPYQTVEQDYANGSLADVIYGYADVTGQTYNAYQVVKDPNGAALERTFDLNNGGYRQVALKSGQTLTSLGVDKMTGVGATTFALDAIYGADTITNFTSADTLLLPAAEFAQLQAALQDGNYSGGNAVLSFADGDTLTFKDMTQAALTTLSSQIMTRS